MKILETIDNNSLKCILNFKVASFYDIYDYDLLKRQMLWRAFGKRPVKMHSLSL